MSLKICCHVGKGSTASHYLPHHSLFVTAAPTFDSLVVLAKSVSCICLFIMSPIEHATCSQAGFLQRILRVLCSSSAVADVLVPFMVISKHARHERHGDWLKSTKRMRSW
jgi:hypothetical protein